MTDIFLAQSGGGLGSFAPLILIVLVFYFFMIRPQMKKAKQQKTFIANLQKGDLVVTNSGVHGKLNSINETTILIQVDKNTQLKVEKSSISAELSNLAQANATKLKNDTKEAS